MTEEDFAIEGLDALPGALGSEIADNGFSAGVIRRIAKHRKRKAITIGLAGSIGSAIAGAQMTALVGALPAATAANETVAPLLSSMSAETIGVTMVAGLVAVVAWIVPSRV